MKQTIEHIQNRLKEELEISPCDQQSNFNMMNQNNKNDGDNV